MQFKLQNGNCKAVIDTKGGELISFKDSSGTEYIWHGDPKSWTGRNPILFPIVGALKDGKVSFPQGDYKMPRHGFARRSEFEAGERGEDFITLELRESPATLEQYPFPFLLRVTHRLTDSGFSTRFEVVNTGKSELPFCIGGHTGFLCPLHDGEAFEDYRLVFDGKEDIAFIHPGPGGCLYHDKAKMERIISNGDTIALDHRIFDRVDTIIFDGLRSGGVSLIHGGTKRGLHFDFSEFPMLAFWTMPNASAPYLCIEPWQGCAAFDNEQGTFSEKLHHVTLKPGENKSLKYSMSVI